jgi:hypothetical protein
MLSCLLARRMQPLVSQDFLAKHWQSGPLRRAQYWHAIARGFNCSRDLETLGASLLRAAARNACYTVVLEIV